MPLAIARCLHCEAAPQENHLRLCHRCAAARGIRILYKKTRSWSPERDARIQRLVERAKARLPLFPTNEEHYHEETPESRSA